MVAATGEANNVEGQVSYVLFGHCRFPDIGKEKRKEKEWESKPNVVRVQCSNRGESAVRASGSWQLGKEVTTSTLVIKFPCHGPLILPFPPGFTALWTVVECAVAPDEWLVRAASFSQVPNEWPEQARSQGNPWHVNPGTSLKSPRKTSDDVTTTCEVSPLNSGLAMVNYTGNQTLYWGPDYNFSKFNGDDSAPVPETKSCHSFRLAANTKFMVPTGAGRL